MRKGAVIVETRNLPDLIGIIGDHMVYLPDFELTIFGSDENKDIIKSFLPDVNFINLGCHLNEFQYNALFTSSDFWEAIHYDKILIFQHDSMMLRPGIDEFLDYDYVGAPWKFQLNGGNGGFSLRSKDMMLKTVNKFPYIAHNHGNEDVYFSNHLPLVGGNVAPREVCKKFSVETIFALGTLGCHAIEKHLTAKQCKQIKTQ
ncbi:unnamed protein product [marine sediment metagenome]|uniref:DUF5672 domain-containing protein n=1 Tax=marine sediment metagenome TaxID=412755 RepID=X1UX29_9ZZZZ